MVSYRVPQGLVTFVVFLLVGCGGLAWALPLPRGWIVVAMFATVLLTSLLFHPRRVDLTDHEILVHYPFWKWSRAFADFQVRTRTDRKGIVRALRLRKGDDQYPVMQISREVLGDQFDLLVGELRRRGIELREDLVPRLYPGPVVTKVNGAQETRFRGWGHVGYSTLVAIGLMAFMGGLVWSLPWGLPIAGAEKVQVCLCAAPVIAIALWCVPRGVMGVIIEKERITIRRIWKRNVVLRREEIADVKGTELRMGWRIDVRDIRDQEVTVYEQLLGARPGELFKAISDFARIDLVC